MENQELERGPDSSGRPTSIKFQKKEIAMAIIAGGILFGTTGCISAMTEMEDEIIREDPEETEPYGNEGIEQEYGFNEEIEQPFGESKFVFPEYGPTLDSEGFPEEGYVESEVGVGEISTPDILVEGFEEVEVEVKEKGEKFEEVETSEDTELDAEKKQEIAYNAVVAAASEFAGQPYSWNAEHHHCSGYVALYFKHLGFNIAPEFTPVSQYDPQITDPMPNATTVKQVPYLKMFSQHYGEDLVAEMEVKTMLTDEEIWGEIPPGTVLYLPERIGHHGYDTFTHVGIFMGLDEEGEPMFSEFSSYMRNGPEYGYGFNQFTRMYRGRDIEPYNPNNGPLMVFMFDAVEASRRIEEYRSFNTQGQEERTISSISLNNLPH